VVGSPDNQPVVSKKHRVGTFSKADNGIEIYIKISQQTETVFDTYMTYVLTPGNIGASSLA
jgi:hypothetical protein